MQNLMEITCHSWRNMWKTDQGKLTIKTTLYSLCRSLIPCQRWGAVRSTSLESPSSRKLRYPDIITRDTEWPSNNGFLHRATRNRETADFDPIINRENALFYPENRKPLWNLAPNRQPMGDTNNDGWQELLVWSCARSLASRREVRYDIVLVSIFLT